MTAAKIPSYVAVHEAGHAVASWVVHRAFDHIFIRPVAEWGEPWIDEFGHENQCGGMVVGERRFDPATAFYFDTEDEETRLGHLEDARLDMVVDMAGPAAEAKYRRRSMNRILHHGSGRTDHETMEEVAGMFAEYEDAEVLMEEAIARARWLCHQAVLWSAVMGAGKTPVWHLRKARSAEPKD